MEHVADPREVTDPRLRELALAAALVAKLDETQQEVEALCGIVDPEDVEPWSLAHEVTAATQRLIDWLRLGRGELPEDEFEEVHYTREVMWRDTPHGILTYLASVFYENESGALEGRVAAWLAEDPTHWPALRRLVFDPWQKQPGSYHLGTPRWVVELGAVEALAAYGHTPYRRTPWVAKGQIGGCDDDPPRERPADEEFPPQARRGKRLRR